MPSKKRKYNARFPAGRIKKIMQTDEDVGKVAQAVPVIISRTLELFVESLLMKAMQITNAKNAKTLSPSHMKQCILSESRFDFLKDLVKNIPDINNEEGRETECDLAVRNISPLPSYPANFYTEQSTSSVQNTASVIQYSRKTQQNPANEKPEMSNLTNISSSFNLHQDKSNVVRIDIPPLVPINQEDASCISSTAHSELDLENNENGLEQNKIPPLAPIVQQVQDIHHYGNQTDNLCIDEDYDN